MKPKPSLRSFLALSGSALLLATQAYGAQYYWDSNSTTAGLGDTAGTWGTTAAWGSMNGGSSRIVILGTQATANTAILAADTVYFGTMNLALGSTASTIGIGTVTAKTIVFGAGQGSQGVTLSGGGTITIGASGGINANNTGINTIGSVLAGTAGMIKGGPGAVTLTGANDYTGTTVVSGGGTLTIGDGTSGNLNNTTPSALTFNLGGGIFNVAQAASSSQSMGALTLTAGEGTVTSTAASGSASQTVTFASPTTRTAGASGNFALAVNSTASANQIVLTGAGTGALLDRGLFFGGSSYAACDTGATPYVRAYTASDTDAVTSPAGLTLGVDDNTKNAFVTGNITAQTTAAVNTLNLAANSLTFVDTASTLSVNGILASAGSVAIANGANASAIQPTSSGGEVVIRVNGASDSLTIAPIIQNNSSASRLTKSGAGTLTLSGTNTYTGTTTINAGTLAVTNGAAIADAGAVVLADAGATLQLNSNETIFDVTGGGLSGGNVNVQGNTLTLSRTTAYTFGGQFTGTSLGGVIKQGAGKLTLSQKNSFPGTFTLDGGTLEFTYGNDGTGTLIALSSGGDINMAHNTTLSINPAANLPAGVIGSQLQALNGGSPAYPYGWTVANDINIASGTSTANILLVGNENAVRFTGNVTGGATGDQTLSITTGSAQDREIVAFSGVIADGSSGTLGLTATLRGANNGTYINLTNNNTFSGPISVTTTGNPPGYLVIGGERYGVDATLITGAGSLGTGGVYSGTISLTNSGAGVSILNYASSADQTLSGAISGTNGRLLKEGIGTLTLSVANSYTGTTTVSTGTLAVNGNNTTTGANIITGGTLAISSIDNVANPNPLGQSSASAANLVLRGGTLQYITGGTASTDRNFAIFSSSAIDASGSGPLSFTQTAAVSPDVTGLSGTTTAGSATVNLTVGTTADLVVGMTVSMTGVPAGRMIASIISPTQFTLSSGTSVTAGTNSASFGYGNTRTLTLTGTNTGNNTIAGVLQNSTAVGSGSTLGLSKTGLGKWVLSNANTYTGGTSVTGGTLTVNGSLADATMSISDATVNGSGALTYNVSGATIDLITVSTGGTLNAAGLTVNVNGTLTEPEYVLVDATGGGSISGTFASLTNGQGYTLNYATANQVKLVAGGGVTFADWRNANSAGSQTLADDHDNDGVDNGTEFFLGGDTDTTGFTALPPVVNTGGILSVTWTKHANYPGAYNTDFVVQTSDTLADPWTTETEGVNVIITVNDVKYTFPNPLGTKKFARLKVTGPN